MSSTYDLTFGRSTRPVLQYSAAVPSRSRPAGVIALVVVAVAGGVAVALLFACFVWAYESGIRVMWHDLPDALDLDPFDSWWIIAVPVVGGLLVGIGQRVVGNVPEPMQDVFGQIRSGGRVPGATALRAIVNSLAALLFGGPLGFEAALVSIIAGSSFWVGDRLRSVERFIAVAAGVDEVDDLPRSLRRLPVWVAAVVGALAYSWMPFGKIDTSMFRFTSDGQWIDLDEGLWIVAIAALVTIPAAWAISVVQRAEEATLFRRAPILIGMAGGLVFALLAWNDEYVLFSGQQTLQHLDGLGDGRLIYIAVAKWAALCIALVAGWRGGPIFPTFVSAAAIAVVLSDVVDVSSDVMIIGAAAGVTAVFLKGNIPAAFVLTLYVAPLSYAGVILLGCVTGALVLAVGARAGLLPRTALAEPADATPA